MLVCAIVLTACVEPLGPGGCTDELRIGIVPYGDTLRVGDVMAPPQIVLSTCGGAFEVSDELVWTNLTPSVVAVTAAGAITAVGPGEANVDVSGKVYGPLATITLTVVP